MTVSAAPRVSILLPAFNAEATLPACLRSILRQREVEWECLVVDDGSEDGTLECARGFAARDPRFRAIPAGRHGLVRALGTGLRHCRAPLVARMDADDLMHRDRLAAQVTLLERDTRLDAVGCHVRVFPRDSLKDGARRYESWLNGIATAEDVRREAFIECPVAHPTLMIRRDLLVEMEYREMGWPEDYDLILRLLAAGKRVGVLPRRHLCWRDSRDRLSRIDNAYSLERFTACKAFHLASTFLADTDRYLLWGYGATGRALRRALLAHDRQPAHIIELHPRRLGNVIHGAPVVPPDELPRLPRLPLLVSVAGAIPRNQIRTALTTLGFHEIQDYLCTA